MTGWTCPSCGRRYLRPNQWHSCGNEGLDAVLARQSPTAVELYWAVEAALGRAGEFRVHPQKTRIAFISEMTFCSVRLARRWVDLAFVVARPIDDPRIDRIELFGPTSFSHQVRLTGPDEIDGDVAAWLAEARRRGDRETLDRRARVEPLVGAPLERLSVPLRARAVRHEDRPALRIPTYAGDAFSLHPDVVARVSGEEYHGRVDHVEGRDLVVFDVGSAPGGLGEGDAVDVFLRADL